MLAVSGVTKAFGGDVVLEDASFSLSPGERAALVGPNGCGKTTLLRIVAGLEQADSGSVSLAPGSRVGYLGQEGQLSPDRSLYDEMALEFSHVFELEREMRALEREMEGLEGSALAGVLERYGAVQARYEHAEAHLVDARIRTVLAGVGFTEADLGRPCREFSGGWQMRGALARLLLGAPDVLLMDEPTNHLDIAAVEWLEEYLAAYKGVVLMVSHDRAFLDRTCSRTLHLAGGQVDDYAGNYSFFIEEALKRRELHLARYKNQQKKLEADRRFIERFRYKATLASRVKSREKMLEKLELLDAPEAEADRIKLGFVEAPDSGREALVAKGVVKRYGSRQVLSGLSLTVERGEKVAIVGRNGAGKSTLLRLLAGQEEPDGGTVKTGLRLSPVYFAQHQAEALDPARTVLEELEAAAPRGTTQTRLRTVLGCLLFSGDDVHKRVGVLSGGEKSRVALARCIVRASNLLFLDEPTNHLDISAREVLLEALSEYHGTIVLVTHDRHFMDGLVSRVLEIEGGQGQVFLGNYSDYRRKKQAEERLALQQREAARAEKKARKTPRPARSERAREVPWKLDALEAKIFSLEEELSLLGQELSDPELYRDSERQQAVQSRYEELTRECEELTALWEEMTV